MDDGDYIINNIFNIKSYLINLRRVSSTHIPLERVEKEFLCHFFIVSDAKAIAILLEIIKYMNINITIFTPKLPSKSTSIPNPS